jgi:integrase/recombinase XerD
VPLGDRPAEPLAPEEVKALLAACGGDSLSAVRDHALYAVMWRAGLRVGEALRIRPCDVSFADGSIRVLHTKTREARTVGIDDAALAAVSVWMDARSAAGIEGEFLFCRLHGQAGEKMSERYVRAQMKRVAVRAGIRKHVRPHGLRHTMAVESLREGISVTKISRQLGHSSIATTQVYLDHLHPTDVVDAYRARTWA